MAFASAKRNHFFDVVNYEVLNPSVAQSLPLTSKGQVLGHNGTALAAISAGTDGHVLTADSADAEGAVFKAIPAVTSFASGWTWASGTRSAVQVIPNNTSTNMTWTVTAGPASITTVPLTGVYLLMGQVMWAANVTGTRYVSFYNNTTATGLRWGENPPVNGANFHTQTITAIESLTAGHSIALRVKQVSGGNLDAIHSTSEGMGSYFSYVYLGP